MLEKEKKSPFETLIIAFAFIGVFFILSYNPVVPDTWWHLRSGEEMVLRREIILTDLFSHTRAGAPWVNAFWLADIILYLIFKVGNFFALGVFLGLMGVLTFWIARKQVPIPVFLNGAFLLLAAMIAYRSWTPRPQIFSFFLLALLDHWLYQVKKEGKRNFWILLPFFALWANLHGGYVWGILLLIAVVVGELFNHWFGDATLQKEDFLEIKAIKNLALFTFFSLFAVLLNPSGTELWRLPFHTMDVSLFIQEWRSPNFHVLNTHPMLWALFLFIFTLANNKKNLSFSDLFKVLGFAYMTFMYQRNITPFAVISYPVFAREFHFLWKGKIVPLFPRLGRRSSFSDLPVAFTGALNSILITLVLWTAITHVYTLAQPEEINDSYPANAVKWIKEKQPEGELFNSYNWGGYLIWNLREYPVFIDGRADLYGEEIKEQESIIIDGGDESQQLLDQWDIRLIILDPDEYLARELPRYGWELYYEDEMSIVYGR